MNTIITIGRQFGSGGREIGQRVADYFGIKFYDKELLSRAAKESGFCEEMIQNHDERPTNNRVLSLFNLMGTNFYIWCVLGSFGVFAVLYAAVYLLTARTYYRLVSM